ncbi:hypothetical protein [Kitasatospora sp. NPDC002040]|uniref:hypothetical protein n=1 Tax=Kitasatospora sp. NPDC002040 TaxID=3154661 RepID=UPI003316D3DF
MSTTLHTERPARRTAPAATRPGRMRWLAWRQSRAGIAVLATGLLALAATLLFVHFSASATVATMERTGCRTPGSWSENGCFALVTRAEHLTGIFSQYLQPVITLLPVLIGMFLGAPLLAQEFERGTHRLVWAQSVTPARWLRARIGLPGLAVLLATGVLAVLSSWVWWTDVVHSPVAFDPPFGAFTYPAIGTAPVAWSLFAFALGLAVGLVLRRTVTAVLVTGALAGISLALMRLARPHLYPVTSGVQPVDQMISTFAQPTNAWLVNSGQVLADGTRVPDLDCYGGGGVDCSGTVARWGDYHPAGDLVPIQLVESGILLLLTIALLAFTFRRTGRAGA